MTSALPVGMQYSAEITAPVPEGTSNGMIQLAGQTSVVVVYLMAVTRTSSGSFVPSLCVLAGLLLICGVVVSRLPEPARHFALGSAASDHHGTDTGECGAQPHRGDEPRDERRRRGIAAPRGEDDAQRPPPRARPRPHGSCAPSPTPARGRGVRPHRAWSPRVVRRRARCPAPISTSAGSNEE